MVAHDYRASSWASSLDSTRFRRITITLFRLASLLIFQFGTKIIFVVVHLFKREVLVAQQSEMRECAQSMCVELVPEAEALLASTTKFTILRLTCQYYFGDKSEASTEYEF